MTMLNAKQILLNHLNYTSKKEVVFDRQYIPIFSKRNESVLFNRLCVYGCVFSFKEIVYV